MNADISDEGGRERKIADEHRFADIRNIQDDKSTCAVGQVGPFTFHISSAVKQRPKGYSFFAAGEPLPRPPPAGYLAWRRGIRDVHDLQNVTVEALRQCSRIDVLAPGVKVAVRSQATGSIMTKLLRIFGINEVPDQKSF